MYPFSCVAQVTIKKGITKVTFHLPINLTLSNFPFIFAEASFFMYSITRLLGFVILFQCHVTKLKKKVLTTANNGEKVMRFHMV